MTYDLPKEITKIPSLFYICNRSTFVTLCWINGLLAPERPYHNVFTSDWCHKRSIIKDADTCADPLIFAVGRGNFQVHLTYKNSDAFFFSPQLILKSRMVTFKENYHFPRFQGDWGGGLRGLLIPYMETHITCDFPGGPPDPILLYLEVHVFFRISIFILRMISRICAGSPEAMQQAVKSHDLVQSRTNPRWNNYILTPRSV